MYSKVIIKYTIECESGLRIGAGNTAVDIGGIDAPVIKDPVTKLPYIPGSSIKGKMRSQYEWLMHSNKLIANRGKVISDIETDVARVYGTTNSDNRQSGPETIIISRGIFANAYLKNTEYLSERLGKGLYTEVKAENSIDRLTSRAVPRFFEQVPRGAEFEGEIIVTIFSEKEREEVLGVIKTSMQLLRDSYLGGGGSRGSGRVKFTKISALERTKNYYIQDEAEKDVSEIFSNLSIYE